MKDKLKRLWKPKFLKQVFIKPKLTKPDPAKPRFTSPVTFTGRIWIYPAAIVAALIFAQSLKLPLSNMIFVFMLTAPLAAAVQLAAARLCIRTSVRSDADTVEKHTPTGFNILISNSCLLPFPFVEAELLVPDERGAVCVPKRAGLSLAPFNSCEFRRTAGFAFRGVYSVGLRQMWVYDCFRIVRLRIKCDSYAEIFVLPRRYELPPKPVGAESDRNTQSVIRQHGSDNTELADIRAYMSGDSLKSIHWKLSSKSQELIVKDFSRNTGNSVYIFCDLEPHYLGGEPQPRTPLPEYADIIDNLNSDLVVEHCLAAALRELRAFNTVTLLWLTEESGSTVPRACTLTNLRDFDQLYRSFAAAPLVKREKQPTLLASLIPDAGDSSLVFVTACLDAASAAEYTQLAAANRSLGAKAVELIWCDDESLYQPSDEAGKLISDRLSSLGARMEITAG